jgi:hypothetical protein
MKLCQHYATMLESSEAKSARACMYHMIQDAVSQKNFSRFYLREGCSTHYVYDLPPHRDLANAPYLTKVFIGILLPRFSPVLVTGITNMKSQCGLPCHFIFTVTDPSLEKSEIR